MRLIDADSLEPYYRLMEDNATGMKMMALPDGIVDQQPTVDAVPVIRCRDCKRWNTIFDRNKAEFGLCQTRSQLEATRYDEYCSRAERKEE